MKVKISMIFLLALLLCGCRDKADRETAQVNRPPVSGVQLTEVAASEVTDYYESSATVKAQSASVVAARMMGTVNTLKVKEGDRVQAGQLLLVLDDRDVRQKINGAEAALIEAEKAVAAAERQKELAGTTYMRFKNLFDGKALTGQELDEALTRKNVAELEYERYQAMVKRARAGLAEARVYEDFTRVTSPVAGVVSKKEIELGTMAMPGVPLFTIEDTASFRVELGVNETLDNRFAPGLPVAIEIPATGVSVTGAISDIVPAVDPGTRSFLVKIALQDAGLQSGLYVKVRIPVGHRSVILVPQESIVVKGELNGVYAVNAQNIVSYRLVRLGKHYGAAREILSGLTAGDKVITAGLEKAVDGGLLQGEKGQ